MVKRILNKPHYVIVLIFTFGLLTLMGCSDNDDDSTPSQNTPPPSSTPTGNGDDGDDTDKVSYLVDPSTIDISTADHCDILQPTKCLYPFPNNFFTIKDGNTDTGLRINLSQQAMPQNIFTKRINPKEWNRNDGFSPGAMIVTHVPGIDMDKTGAVPLIDIEQSLDSDAPVLVINADSGERHLIWSELDANATEEEGRALIIRPARNFMDGQRYIVALRQLIDKEGNLIPPGDAFLVFRDDIPSNIEAFESRRIHMEDIFSRLQNAGVNREDLFLAWDFTVASTRNLTGRMLHIRDDAFDSLGGHAPEFEITEVENDVNDRIRKRIRGKITVPNYMNTFSGRPGSRFYYGPDDDELPDRLFGINTLEQDFTCNIPHVAFEAYENDDSQFEPRTTRPSLYGHGLLGDQEQVNNTEHVGRFGNTHNLMFCAVDWLGMSTSDVLNVIGILPELSNFGTLADRCQQGFLGALFLARLLKHEDGFVANEHFQTDDGSPLFDNSDVFYDGNSQGGIMGGALIAVSTDIKRGVLGVPGMNYSLLLRRSKDFDAYGNLLLYPSYQDTLDRSLLLSLIQMLWDRGEANGYANHMTDKPLKGTPAHEVLLQVAYGDHQVSHTSAEIEARTIGAHIHAPGVAEGRHHDIDPYFDIPEIPEYPFDGSAMVIWDGGPVPNDNDDGTPTPPVENVPPREGTDPHERPRRQENAILQKSEFLKPDGKVVNVCYEGRVEEEVCEGTGEECESIPCFSDGYTGVPVK